MSRPICETMTNRPAPGQDGWVQWGVLSADGQTFTPLYPLEAALPTPSAYYYLAAAGVCTVQGQPNAGALLPNDAPQANPVTPQPQPLETAANTVQVPMVADVTPAANNGGTPVWAWGVGLVLLLIAGGAAASKARRRQSGKTPPPKGFTFNQGESDAD